IHEKLSVHEKEIVVSSFDYYGRVLTPKEIKNLKESPPNKYSPEVKEDVLDKMKQYVKLSNGNDIDWKQLQRNSSKKHLIIKELEGQFPEILRDTATPAMRQFFYSELASFSKESEQRVKMYIDDNESYENYDNV